MHVPYIVFRRLARRLTHRRCIIFGLLGIALLGINILYRVELAHDGAEFCLVPIIEHLLSGGDAEV